MHKLKLKSIQSLWGYQQAFLIGKHQARERHKHKDAKKKQREIAELYLLGAIINLLMQGTTGKNRERTGENSGDEKMFGSLTVCRKEHWENDKLDQGDLKL